MPTIVWKWTLRKIKFVNSRLSWENYGDLFSNPFLNFGLNLFITKQLLIVFFGGNIDYISPHCDEYIYNIFEYVFSLCHKWIILLLCPENCVITAETVILPSQKQFFFTGNSYIVLANLLYRPRVQLFCISISSGSKFEEPVAKQT